MTLTIATIVIIFSGFCFICTHIILGVFRFREMDRTNRALWDRILKNEITDNDARVSIKYIKDNIETAESKIGSNYVAIKRIERHLEIDDPDF